MTPDKPAAAPPREWFIQKPIAHNCPLKINGAVFQTFMPTVSEQNCEWVRVVEYSALERLERELNEARSAGQELVDL